MTTQKDIAEVQELIQLGKKRGYVTYEEMNNFLPTHLVSSERLDDVMIMFNDLDIEVVNEARKRRQAELTGTGQVKEERAAANDATRSNDPVRVYLRKMGSVSLLSREGEIEIAKRIEEGELTVKRIALTSAVGVAFIQELIAEDEERIQKAVRSGKKPRPTKTRGGKTLNEVLQLGLVLNARLADMQADARRAKSKKRAHELGELAI